MISARIPVVEKLWVNSSIKLVEEIQNHLRRQFSLASYKWILRSVVTYSLLFRFISAYSIDQPLRYILFKQILIPSLTLFKLYRAVRSVEWATTSFPGVRLAPMIWIPMISLLILWWWRGLDPSPGFFNHRPKSLATSILDGICPRSIKDSNILDWERSSLKNKCLSFFSRCEYVIINNSYNRHRMPQPCPSDHS